VEHQKLTGMFNNKAKLPYELRLRDFEMAMQDGYDFFYAHGELGQRYT
jgi:hypothetical protein